MAYKLVVLPRAEADIVEAFTHLSEKSPEAAQRWYRLIKSEIETLATMPLRCALAPEATKLGIEIRQLLHGQRPGVYRILFRVIEESSEEHILAVRHGARKPLDDDEFSRFSNL